MEAEPRVWRREVSLVSVCCSDQSKPRNATELERLPVAKSTTIIFIRRKSGRRRLLRAFAYVLDVCVLFIFAVVYTPYVLALMYICFLLLRVNVFVSAQLEYAHLHHEPKAARITPYTHSHPLDVHDDVCANP